MLSTVVFKFDDQLHDFLLPEQRGHEIMYRFQGKPAIKDVIEALGVPHTEVKYILVDELPVDFNYYLQHDDEVVVYSIMTELADLEPLTSAPSEIRFVADVHLGSLARQLRLLGFDTLYNNQFSEADIAELAQEQQRIVLTRNTDLLKHKIIRWGYWLRSQDTEQQLAEVLHRYGLKEHIDPFQRCMVCNGDLHKVDKASVEAHLPPNTKACFNDFWQCEQCQRVYWQGSHYERMNQFITQLKQSA